MASGREDQPPPPGLSATPPEGMAPTSPLAPQLGSDADYLGRGQTDMRRLSVITEADIPLLLYAKIRGRKSRVWRTIYDEFLNLRVSVGGRGRRDIIRMEGVSKGGVVNVESEIQKPNWFVRNVLDRDWEKKEREKLGL
ncbi:MAG: hypothetical protein JRD89_01200 [Deltaproteobacteria bacterium]|nr:hypothetical protein [Deltaproteobacteria bacterium]